MPVRPRRTIRVVLFGSEEMDYSGPAFAAAHQAEAEHFVVASEADFGGDRALQVQLPAGAADTPLGRTLAELLAPMRVILSREPALRAGDDLARLKATPFFSIRQDGTRYFDIHHSADDTLDKIDRRQLDQIVATWAMAVYLAADSDLDFRAEPPRSTAQP